MGTYVFEVWCWIVHREGLDVRRKLLSKGMGA